MTGPVGALYTRWLYVIAESPAARRLALERLAQSEAEQAAEEASRPPRLVYAEQRGKVTAIRTVELPGVVFDAPLYPERVWKYVEWGVEVSAPDHESRLWLGETENGLVFPLETEPALSWARERTMQI